MKLIVVIQHTTAFLGYHTILNGALFAVLLCIWSFLFCVAQQLQMHMEHSKRCFQLFLNNIAENCKPLHMVLSIFHAIRYLSILKYVP